MTQYLANQRILFLGASRGIGLAAARMAHAAGARVVLAGRDPARLERAGAELGTSVSTEVTDITDEEKLRALYEKLGKLDHIVVTAASSTLGPLATQSTEALRALIESKVVGQTLAVKYGAPCLSAGGSIVLCSGIVTRKPFPGGSAYAAVGAATEAAARVWALEYAPVRINVVLPGVIDTPVWGELMDKPAKDDFFGSLAATLPSRRTGRPEDVAEAISFLLGASFVTGTTLEVDGGHHLI